MIGPYCEKCEKGLTQAEFKTERMTINICSNCERGEEMKELIAWFVCIMCSATTLFYTVYIKMPASSIVLWTVASYFFFYFVMKMFIWVVENYGGNRR